MNTVATQIQTEALIESLTNDIDTLAVLDRQVKALTAQCKTLKDGIANTYGEGKFRGEQYGVSVALVNTTTVDYKALLAELGATPEQVAKYTVKGASIRITVTA